MAEHSERCENMMQVEENLSNSSSDSDGLSDSAMEDEGILNLQKVVDANPFQYDSHLELIKELRSLGDLEKLRGARENMAEIFPLTEELWIEWFNDEMPLIVVPGHKEYIISLFEKATQDYLSVRVWLQYCQFVLDSIESSTGIEAVRKIYERAITAVGIHLTEGCSVWDSYREFEMTLLESMQAGQQDSENERIEAQINKVEGIYRRQLGVPLLGMETTWEEYEDWTSEPIPESTKKAYEKAISKLEKCLQFENKLSTAALPKLDEYQEYISFELKDGDPARVQCIFERAIKENCLHADVWQQYTNYLDHKLKVPSIAVKVHSRAVRNCPWVSSLWNDYVKALARNDSSTSDIKEVFQKALGCGFSSSEEYLQLWLTYCDYMKGRITSWESDGENVEDLRKTFDEALTYMDHYFGIDGESCLIRRYWAGIEARYFNNLKKAQELWDAIMKAHSKETHMWLEYTHFLRLHGDILSCRRAFQRAVQITVDDPVNLCEAFINFERVEGNSSQLEAALERTKNHITRVDMKRLKDAEEEAEKLKANVEKEERRKLARLQKNRENKKLAKQQKIKESGATKSYEKAKKTNKPSKKEDSQGEHQNVIENSSTNKVDTTKQKETADREEPETEEPPSKKPRVEEKLEKQNENQDVGMEVTEDAQEDRKAYSEATMKQTVFLSNLLFTVDEKAIKSKFEQVGDINEIRIVKNQAGRSKGYAYLEFNDELSAKQALLMDRELLNGRPMFVSPCVDKSKNQPQQFRYKLSLDKQTVFVTNLPFEATREEIEGVFKTAGEIKEVRIVTNRAGKPKGYAYVEYINESSAKKAVLNLDKHVMKERPINVALSKPPARKQNESSQVDERIENTRSLPQGSRGRARTQLAMLPRSVHTHSSSKPSENTKQEKKNDDDKTISSQSQGKMNNADFSKLFAK